MLLVAGIVVYQVKGNFFPFQSIKGAVVGNCSAGYLTDSVCDTVHCTQNYNTGMTDPATGTCIVEARVCQDSSLCELPPPTTGDPMASCCKNTSTNSIFCSSLTGDNSCPSGSTKLGEFDNSSCISDCQMLIDNTLPPASAPALPPAADINPIPPDTSDVEPPDITITPPTTNQSASMSSLASSQNTTQKTCTNKEKTGSVTGESDWIQASLWANFEQTKKNEALMSAQGKCASATSILVDGCGTCVDKGVNRTLTVSTVTYSQATKLNAGVTYIKSIATGTCKAIRTCDCPTTMQSCQKL